MLADCRRGWDAFRSRITQRRVQETNTKCLVMASVDCSRHLLLPFLQRIELP